MSFTRTAFLTTALLAGTSLAASAATYSETVTFGPTLTDFTTPVITIPSFNTTLGTLTGATVTLSAAASFAGTVTNNAASPQSAKVTAETDVSLISTTVPFNSLNVALIASEIFTAVPGGTTVNFGPYTISQTDGPSAGSPLSIYNTGPLQFQVTTFSGTTILGGGNNFGANITEFVSGTVTVDYTYTTRSVPEPASMAILGAGLAGIGMIRRRRKG